MAHLLYGGSVYLEAQRQAQIRRAGSYMGGAGKAGWCDPTYPKVFIPRRPRTWTTRKFPFVTSKCCALTRTGSTGTGTGRRARGGSMSPCSTTPRPART